MQLKLALIPYYKDSRLYDSLVEIKQAFFVGAGYKGKKTLVFYNTTRQSEHIDRNETGKIEFPDFKTAYEFIKTNKIYNFNLRNGSYDKELKIYELELEGA